VYQAALEQKAQVCSATGQRNTPLHADGRGANLRREAPKELENSFGEAAVVQRDCRVNAAVPG
jgi:hypothetical protein